MIKDSDVLQIFKKYGFSSKNSFPYIYRINNGVGVCYRIDDSIYGNLERIALFNNIEELDLFLKRYSWYKKYKNKKHIRIVLNNYQVLFPSISYMIDDKLVFNNDIDKSIDEEKVMDDLSRYKNVAIELLKYYEHSKEQMEFYLNNYVLFVDDLKYRKYLLDKEIALYKKSKKKIEYTNKKVLALKKVEDANIKKFKNKIARARTIQDYQKIIKRIWDLNKSIETYDKYNDALLDGIFKYNEMLLVNKKIDYLINIKNKKHILPMGLNKKFKEIEIEYSNNLNKVYEDFIESDIKEIERKYGVYDKLDELELSSYLKMSHGRKDFLEVTSQINRVKDSSKYTINYLNMNYNLLDVEERNVLSLYNSKFKYLFDLILSIPDFDKWSNKKMVKYLDSIESVSRFKEEIDKLKLKIDLDINKKVKEDYFSIICLDSFEKLVNSVVELLKVLKDINKKMILNDDMIFYFKIDSFDDLKNKYVYYLTSNKDDIVADVKINKGIMGIVRVKKNTPVLYSPYELDFGNLYGSNDDVIKVKRNEGINIILDAKDVIINRDSKSTIVSLYKPIIEEEKINYVKEMEMVENIEGCNFIIKSKLR